MLNRILLTLFPLKTFAPLSFISMVVTCTPVVGITDAKDETALFEFNVGFCMPFAPVIGTVRGVVDESRILSECPGILQGFDP